MPRRTPVELHLPLSLLLLCACSTVPLAGPDAERNLAAAEAAVVANDPDRALAELAPLAEEACPKRLRDRRDLCRALALLAQGERWDAWLILEKFSDLYPYSELRPTVVQKVWEIGEALSRSDRGFLFFWSDRRASRTVLEHLVTRHPDSEHLDDALCILGDQAFDDDNHELAQRRYRDLMLDRPESEWVGYAQFRFAMSIVASLEGPNYDLDSMQRGERELRDYLDGKPENPEFVATATAALARLRDWQVERHLFVASFYRRVANLPGELHHLELAAGPAFAGTQRHAEATALRDEVRARATRTGTWVLP
ncbi:MAG: outer membrane protein assembly factor BamD [Planctomycetes bacterium]|nr:outer membrane protein assembly factor BamD [Planctomycetota bacterium]